jgi:hypothetical protein
MNRITISLIFLIVISIVLPTSAIMYAQGQPGCCEPAPIPIPDQSMENTTSTGGSTASNNTGNTTSTGGSTASNNTGNTTSTGGST